MNWRELLFVLGFAAAPTVIWFWRMDPLLDRHSEALQMQVQARMAESMNKKYIHERDQLGAEWDAFRPLAEAELVDLGNDLNPILLQNRVLDLARRFECELRIEDRTDKASGGPPSFGFSGSGRPLQVQDFLRYLERGKARARFTEVTVALQQVDLEEGVEAYFNGRFSIPNVPEAEVEEGPADDSEPNGTGSDPDTQEVES